MQSRAGRLFRVARLAAALYFSVGSFKNRQQFFVLLQRAAVGVGTAAARVGIVLSIGFFCRRLAVQPPFQPGGQMCPGGHLVPFDQIPGPVGAEHRIRRVFHIRVGVIPRGGDDLVGVMAGVVPGRQHSPAAQPVGVGRDLPRIATRRRHRQTARQPHRAA